MGRTYLSIIITAVLAIAFTAFVVLVGAPVVKRVAPRIENLKVSHALFISALLLCLGISVTAAYIGVAAIVGAFLAGMAFAEVAEERPAMHKEMVGVTEFLVPFFLVNIGLQLRLEVFSQTSVIAFAILVTLIAVITKLVGCGLGARASVGSRLVRLVWAWFRGARSELLWLRLVSEWR